MGAFSRKRLRERFITFASAVYNVCIRGCKRYPWWTHVFAFKVDQIGPGGCSALQGWLQCTAEAVAVHCGSGCSALRLRWAKLAPKSSVLFWTREKGGETRPIWVSEATLIYLVSIERALVAMMRFPISSLAVSKIQELLFCTFAQSSGNMSA